MFSLLFNYTKLFGWLSIYKYYKNDIILSLIIKNIHNCGCVAIKLTQWILPLLEIIETNDYTNEIWFHELENVYENCNVHSMSHTKEIYYKNFKHDIEDVYEIDSIIASGSIGQVLKIISREDKQIYAMKIIHPDLKKQIQFVKLLLFFLYNIPYLNNYIIQQFPFNIKQFINDFEKQTYLVNESNNMIQFYNNYKDNPYIIIPKIKYISHDFLIMSYEPGTRFDNIECSEYQKYKCILLLQLFIKNNQVLLNFNHGDIHKGNWKVTICNNEPKLIIYDYGICWGLPDKDKHMLEFIDDTFLKIEKGGDCLNELIVITDYLFKKKCSKKIISETLQKPGVILNPEKLIEIIIKIAKKEYIILDSLLLNIVIVIIQFTKYFEKYDFIRDNTGLKQGQSHYEYFRKRLLDIYCFIKTKDIFKEYQTFIEEKLTTENVCINELFETIDTENDFQQYNLDAIN